MSGRGSEDGVVDLDVVPPSVLVIDCGKIAERNARFGRLRETPLRRKYLARETEASRFHAVTY